MHAGAPLFVITYYTMALSETYIAHLLLKKMTGDLTAEETAALEAWRRLSAVNQQKYDELTSRHSLQQKIQDFREADAKAAQIIVPDIDAADSPSLPVRTVHRMHFLRKWGWAAAVILLAGTVAYFLTSTKQTAQPLADGNRHMQTEITPGGNKATLTLADGSSIVLDSAAGGELAMQGNTRIIKDVNGKIAYNPKDADPGSVLMNTLSTPRGGQYQLTLPDGTHVWLNAASSITFPAAFAGNQRRVEITGEVYFEVVKRKSQPFIASVNGRQSVEVLGTQFNINSYTDEADIQTTLITGSVKIKSENPGQAGEGAAVVLQPGQQSLVPASGRQPKGKTRITIKPGIDIEKVMAWKNGLFNFNGADVPSVMRQLERWYDIQVRYEGEVPAIRFKGELDRGVNLSEILKILPEIGIRYRMEGRTLVVL